MAARRLARALDRFLLLSTFFWGSMALAQSGANPTRVPKSPRYQPPAISKPSPIPAQVLDPYLCFVQKVIFPVDGARSAVYPTGLACPRQLSARHGTLLGFVPTPERFAALRIHKHGRWRVYEPVEANGRWRHQQDSAGGPTQFESIVRIEISANEQV